MSTQMKHGNFTGLASNYSKFRPSYSNFVLNTILSLYSKPPHLLNFVDVGAGTGIWTRKLAAKEPASITGVEPNADMIYYAKKDSSKYPINWIEAPAENTTLLPNSADLISMASSFHWTNFDQAINEFHRVLKDNGYFLALWNPRSIKGNKLLNEIEDYLYSLKPSMKRVSSGSSKSTEDLMEKVKLSSRFKFIFHIEAPTYRKMTSEEYLGVWESVNDIKFQLGESLFREFLDYMKHKLQNIDSLSVCNLTRAWIFQKI